MYYRRWATQQPVRQQAGAQSAGATAVTAGYANVAATAQGYRQNPTGKLSFK